MNDDLPAGVRTAVLTAAAQVPVLPHDLSSVRRKARTIRRRRTSLRAAVAVVVIAAIGAAVPLLRPSVPPDTFIGDPPGLPPLGLWRDRNTLPVTQGVPSGNHIPGSGGEIAARLRTVNGRSAVEPVAEQSVRLGPAPLPGGLIATIAAANTENIVVVDAAGRTVSSRPLPKTDSYLPRPMPLAGSATSLYWWQISNSDTAPRPVLVAYDFTTGKLRELTPRVEGNGFEIPYTGMQATTDRIVTWPAEFGRTCTADVRDAATGELVTRLRPKITGCTDVYFALSADGSRVAALVTRRDGQDWSQRVFALDARTGEVRKEFRTPPLDGPGRTALVYGIDWIDGHTIRYARGLLPGPDGGAPDPVVRTFRL